MMDPADGCGGIAVRLDEHHHYDIELAGGTVEVNARIGPVRTTLAARPVPAGQVVLGIEVVPRSAGYDARSGPDTVSLGVQEPDGTFTALASLDGRYLSTEVGGGFTGRVMGMYAAAGTVHFDWFDYQPIEV